MSLHFQYPWWLAGGLLVALAILLLYRRFDRRRETDLAKLVHPRFLQGVMRGFSPRLRHTRRTLFLLAVLALFAALARPQKGYEWREVKRRGIDILFAVDTSRSMLAQDLKPDRLERARIGILDFIARLQGDRVGLIPFAGSAFALCPLTLDYNAFRESLAALDTDLIPKQGTDIASAIRESQRLFDESGNNHRILILITDGEDLQGDVLDAAKKAAGEGLTIFPVGVGSPEGATIPLALADGRTELLRDASGNVVHTKLDESTLKQIAEITGGMYVPLGNAAQGLDTIYREKLKLVPQTDLSQRLERIPIERYEWPLGFALLLLVIGYLLPDRKPQRRLAASATALAALLLLLLAVPSLRAADPRQNYNTGTTAYHQGEFQKAAESLRTSLQTTDLSLQQRAYYNLGNTLYRVGQQALETDPKSTMKSWEDSLKAYEDSLALAPDDADAQYNRELVKKKLEELKQQEQQQDQDQKDQDQKDQDQKDQDQKDQDQKDQDQKDQDQKDQDQKDQDQKDQDQKDQDQKDQDQKDQDQKDQDQKDQDQKDQDQKDQDQKDQDQKDQDQKDQDQKDQDQKNQDQKDQDQKDQDQKDQDQKDQDSSEQEAQSASETREEKQQMSPEEAAQLLKALQSDERTVIPIERQPQGRFRRADNTKGKTW